MNTADQRVSGYSKMLVIGYFGHSTVIANPEDHVFSNVTTLGKVLFYQIKLFHSNPES